MKTAKDYPIDFVKPLELCFTMLNNCNIRFFDEHVESLKKYWSKFFSIFCVLIYYGSLTVFVVQILFNGTKGADMTITVPVYMIATQAILKMIVLILNKKEIKSIINELGNMWRTDLTEEQMNKENILLKKLDLCQKILSCTSLLGAWIYSLAPLLGTLLYRFVLDQDCALLLPFPCSYPFDATSNWVVYLGVYLFEVYSNFHLVYAYMGTEFLIVALYSHLVTEFTILREDLLNMKPVSNQTDAEEDHTEITIANIVKKHQKLTIISKQLDSIFNKINFIILLFATIIICFFAFGCKVAHEIVFMMVNYLAVTGMLVPLFILCYYGELLRTESVGIADSTYSNLWYKGGKRYQTSVLLIMLRAQEPCCLTSLNYAPITLNTFSKVLSTTWSYFSLLSRLYDEGY